MFARAARASSSRLAGAPRAYHASRPARALEPLARPPTAADYATPGGPADSNPLRLADASLAEKVTVRQHYVHIKTTANNTLITLCNEKQEPVPEGVWSGGTAGFKGARKGEFEAGYQCAVAAFKRMEELLERDPGVRFELLLSGAGKGREAVLQALTLAEGERVRGLVNRLTDKTPLKIGGTRAKKVRRV